MRGCESPGPVSVRAQHHTLCETRHFSFCHLNRKQWKAKPKAAHQELYNFTPLFSQFTMNSVKRAGLGLDWKSCQNGGVYGPRWDGGRGRARLGCSKYSGEITSLPGGWRDQLVPCDAAISSGLSPGPLRPGWVSRRGLHLQPLLITADEAKHLPLLDHVRHQLLPPASVQSANWCKSVNHQRERGRLTGMQSDSV